MSHVGARSLLVRCLLCPSLVLSLNMMFVIVVCVYLLQLCTSSYQQCDQPLINNVADFILQQLINNYPDSVKLANISSSFLYNTGTVEAKFGKLSRVSSIRRKGDLVLNVHNSSVNIILDITFLYLTVFYEEYKLSIAGLSTSGSLSTAVVDNLIQIDITMGEKSLCFITINRIKFLELKDFEVRLRSSCEVCSKITSYVTSTALNYLKKRIKSMIEAKINDTLYKLIKPDNPVVCKKLNTYFND